jgi:SpoVK/Ycf46/Vps4 family AAA+-type ATPase
MSCLIESLEWYTGAELQNVCREAALIALRENNAATVVTRDHFMRAIAVTGHAFNEHTIRQYLRQADRDTDTTMGATATT